MNFSIVWSPKANGNLERLEQQIAQRIIAKIELVKEDPFRYLEHFEGENVYKLRIGDYRLLVELDLTQNLIVIRFLDHRKRVYKR